jgi:hypothetical protein
MISGAKFIGLFFARATPSLRCPEVHSRGGVVTRRSFNPLKCAPQRRYAVRL